MSREREGEARPSKDRKEWKRDEARKRAANREKSN